MLNQTTFTPTQARQNFFQLLRMAEMGKEITIVKPRDPEIEIKLTAQRKVLKKDIVKIAKEMGKIGFPYVPIKQMRKIILTKSDIDL